MNVPMYNDRGHAKPAMGGYLVPPQLGEAFLNGEVDAKEFNRLVGGPCVIEPDDMVGVREYGDGLPVKLRDDTSAACYGDLPQKRWTLVAFNEAGYCSTHVDLLDMFVWVRDNRPDLLATVGLGKVE